jgi:hypothetical protein
LCHSVSIGALDQMRKLSQPVETGGGVENRGDS